MLQKLLAEMEQKSSHSNSLGSANTTFSFGAHFTGEEHSALFVHYQLSISFLPTPPVQGAVISPWYHRDLHKPPGNIQHVSENKNDQRMCRGQGKSNHSKEAKLWWGNQQPEPMHSVSGKVGVRKCTKPGLTIRVFLYQKNECQSSHVS